MPQEIKPLSGHTFGETQRKLNTMVKSEVSSQEGVYESVNQFLRSYNDRLIDIVASGIESSFGRASQSFTEKWEAFDKKYLWWLPKF